VSRPRREFDHAAADPGLDGAQAGEPASKGRSPWYLERGTERREPLPADDVPSVLADLVGLLRDGGIPGFYDGQFAVTADRFDELARVASDPDMHHTLRMMAVMALQEAGGGEALAEVLEPLLVPVADELRMDRREWDEPFDPMDEEETRQYLDVELSRHARFALAKDGQPDAIMDRIREMEVLVDGREAYILDPLIPSTGAPVRNVAYYREMWFQIGYHYQQLDDFEAAARWYRALTDNLEGSATRWALYNLACIQALQGRTDEAMAHLERAHSVGFLDVAWLEEDGDLESLRDREDYRALVRELRGNAREEASGEPEEPAGRDEVGNSFTSDP